MFGSNQTYSGGASTDRSAIIRSGYNPTVLHGADKLRSQMHQALLLDPEQTSEENIKKFANAAGQLKSIGEKLKRESRQRLETAKEAVNVRNILWQHAQQAASLEIRYEQGEARNLQQMSGKLLDLGVTQEQHSGFSRHLDIAERVLKF